MAHTHDNTFRFILLALASIVCVILVVARFVVRDYVLYAFLPWNLFLAWLPLLFAWLTVRWAARWWLAWPAATLWLLFLPNSPYLITDLIHLRRDPTAPIWYDVILLFMLALTGLYLGLTSLHWMQGLVRRRWGALTGWLFTLGSMGLCAFGIYLGRNLRWNSWDALLRPRLVLGDILAPVLQPVAYWQVWVLVGLYVVLFLFAYLMLFGPRPESQVAQATPTGSAPLD